MSHVQGPQLRIGVVLAGVLVALAALAWLAPASESQPPQTLEQRWQELLADLPPCENLTEPGAKVVSPDLDCRDGNNWSVVGIDYPCAEGGTVVYSLHGDRPPVVGRPGGLWYISHDTWATAAQLNCRIVR